MVMVLISQPYRAISHQEEEEEEEEVEEEQEEEGEEEEEEGLIRSLRANAYMHGQSYPISKRRYDDDGDVGTA
ncbi:hypothetical protein M0804_000429 [Polistes exclamans]|nr:hypothetical protein M0804_000429 [Polistes exclamans]